MIIFKLLSILLFNFYNFIFIKLYKDILYFINEKHFNEKYFQI
jgi:hypothetical protein